MPTVPPPFAPEQLHAIAAAHGTPVYLYDAAGIQGAAARLMQAFAWADGFRNYFAVKATPNPHILQLLAAQGCGADCSSLAELRLAEMVGLRGEQIMYTANFPPPAEYLVARELGALINLDDAGDLPLVIAAGGPPEWLCFRYNPGPLRQGNQIIGAPEEAKFGMPREQLLAGYVAARAAGVRRFGLHAMIVSNELRVDELAANAEMLFDLAADLAATIGIRVELINLGGGIGIPYHPDQQPVDLNEFAARVRGAYERTFVGADWHPRLAMECGRLLTGPHGYLLTRVRSIKASYRLYAGLDATMANLMRPGMYGAYHHVTVVGRETAPADAEYDLVGSLCENNDKFAIRRPLPTLSPGDLLLIHDAGAHGHAMGFNYNGKLRSAELLIDADGSVQLIRRAETLTDYFATLTDSFAVAGSGSSRSINTASDRGCT